ncbi:MAG: AbrB/MazE/SpoVT family DNA-binding domain-containing protein [Planctomycetes bacterium]|nr:AbrB/MazE/SpoVT family DNA-binding domain-containing protein [Planctomycetota bacterium]
MQIEMASVSTKGQVVIPGTIRKRLGISAGSKLIVMTDGENVLMKPVIPPRLETFRELAEESRKAAAKAKLTTADLARALTEVRGARGD